MKLPNILKKNPAIEQEESVDTTAPLVEFAREAIRQGADRQYIETALARMGGDPALIGEVKIPPPPPFVRNATEEDEPALMDFCIRMHAENGMLPLSEDKMLDFLQVATRNKGAAILGVIMGEDGVEAVLYLKMEQPYYSEDYAIFEQGLFIHPDHRGGNHFDLLVEWAKRVQAKMSADMGVFIPLVISIFSEERTEAKIKLWKTKFPLIGAIFAWTKPGGDFTK